MRWQVSLFLFFFLHTCISGQSDHDYTRLHPKLTLPKGQSAESILQISPNGKYLLTGSDKSAMIWEYESGKLLHELPGHARYITSAEFSPDGRYVITESLNNGPRLWDVFSGSPIRYISDFEKRSILANNGNYIIDLNRMSVSLLHLQTGDTLFQKRITDVKDVMVGPEANYLLVNSRDGRWISWDLSSGEPTRAFDSQYLSYTADKQFLLSLTGYAVEVFNAKDLALVNTLIATRGVINSFDLHPNGDELILYTTTGDIETRNILTGVLRPAFHTSIRMDSLILQANRPLADYTELSPDGKALIIKSNGTSSKMYDALSGRILFEYAGFEKIKFSPDGRQFISDSSDKKEVFDAKTGALLYELKSPGGSSFIYSPNGDHLITGSSDIQIRDAQHGNILRRISNQINKIRSAVYHLNPPRLLIIEDQQVKLWDLQHNLILSNSILELSPGPYQRPPIIFNQDSTNLLIVGADEFDLWDGRTGKKLHSFSRPDTKFEYPAFSPDGKQIVFSQDSLLKIWDIPSGAQRQIQDGIGPVHYRPDNLQLLCRRRQQLLLLDPENGQIQLSLPMEGIFEADYSPSGKYLVTAQRIIPSSDQESDQEANVPLQPTHTLRQIRNANTGELHFEVRDQSFLISPDERYIFVWNGSENIGAIRDFRTGQLIHDKIRNDLWFNYYAFNPNGLQLVSFMREGSVDLWDVKSGERTLLPHTGYEINRTAFSKDGSILAVISDQLVLDLFDTRSSTLLQTIKEGTGITKLQFLESQNLLLLYLADGSMSFRKLDTGEELFKLFFIWPDEWVILHKTGLFDASSGAMHKIHYVLGDEIINLEQLKSRYYEPGLLQKLLGYSDERIRPLEAFDNLRLYPVIEANIEKDSLYIRLQSRNGGIGKASIFINDKEVVEEVNPPGRGSDVKRDSLIRYDLKQHQNYLFRHPDSTNIISIRAYNEEGWLKSRAVELMYKVPGGRARGSEATENDLSWAGQLDPKLYVVSIGTSNYTGTKLDLQYADQDATMMARALNAVGTALFTSGDSLEVFCLSTASPDSTGLEGTPIQWQTADKTNIQSVFKKIKQKAKAEDVILVYLSGHGVTQGGTDQTQFYYLTRGVASEDALSDPATRQAYTISSEELTDWINDIPALKQVLIIDACNSGQIVENLTGGTKALNSSQIRALDRMKDRTGMFVLSGSASDKVSYEAGEYGQGLLTYALLQGMLGVATRKDQEGKETIDVMTLFQYARDQVPKLASSINGIQTPMLGFPNRAASFDIGILDERARSNIPIGNKKPVMIKSVFMNKNTFLDELELAEQLETAFREETVKGSEADLIYVDVYDYPGAYSIRGMYETTLQGIQIELKLFKDLTNPIKLEVEPTDDPERLIKLIMRKIKRVVENSGN